MAGLRSGRHLRGDFTAPRLAELSDRPKRTPKRSVNIGHPTHAVALRSWGHRACVTVLTACAEGEWATPTCVFDGPSMQAHSLRPLRATSFQGHTLAAGCLRGALLGRDVARQHGIGYKKRTRPTELHSSMPCCGSLGTWAARRMFRVPPSPLGGARYWRPRFPCRVATRSSQPGEVVDTAKMAKPPRGRE